MIHFKKMEEKDFVFVSKKLSDKEDKAFSEFLKKRKKKVLGTTIIKKHKKRKEIQNQ